MNAKNALPLFSWGRLLGLVLLLSGTAALQAQHSFSSVTADVNKRMVKLYGVGGFKSLPSFGTGILVSPHGHILTVNNHLVTEEEIRVYLYDGRKYLAKLIAKEPELDIVMLQIKDAVFNLPHFDMDKAGAAPMAESGDFILAFSNQFSIAAGDEPMSVGRGVIAAVAELRGKRGAFSAPFSGPAYFLDAIACNPGAAGGALTTRKGELLGILGRELKSDLSDSWINYAVPINAKVELILKDKPVGVDIVKFSKEAVAGTYRQGERKLVKIEKSGFSGILLVPSEVNVTPPYVEEVIPGSPAAKAGLRADDLILYVNGDFVPNIKEYRDIMAQVAPNQEVRLDVQRQSKLVNVKLTLAEPPKGMK